MNSTNKKTVISANIPLNIVLMFNLISKKKKTKNEKKRNIVNLTEN